MQKEEALKAKQKAEAKLRKGDYVVQVHLIEGRDFKGRDMTAMSDPVVVVSCMKQKRSSKIHKVRHMLQ